MKDETFDDETLGILPTAPDGMKWIPYEALEAGDRVMGFEPRNAMIHEGNPIYVHPRQDVDLIEKGPFLEGVDRHVWKGRSNARESLYEGLLLVRRPTSVGPLSLSSVLELALVRKTQ